MDDIHSACVHNTWTRLVAQRAKGLRRGSSMMYPKSDNTYISYQNVI